MDYGFNRFDMRSVAGFADSVALGESLGYSVAWIPASPLLAMDPYVMLSHAATATSTIRLGPMLENPVTRHPGVIAGSIATIANLSGGRAELALGVGDTAVRTLGLSPARVKTLESATRMIKRLLEGERIRFGDTASRLRHAQPVPVWIAAGGPRTLQMAGAIADGVIIRVGTHPDNIGRALTEVRQGAEAAGRDPATVKIATVFHTVMDDDAQVVGTIGRAIAAGYYEYAPYLFDNIDAAWDGPDVDVLREQVWQDFHHTPDLVAAGRLVSFLADETLDAFCLHGPAPQIASQLEAIQSRHPEISLVMPHPMTPPAQPGEQPHLEFMRRFAETVIAG